MPVALERGYEDLILRTIGLQRQVMHFPRELEPFEVLEGSEADGWIVCWNNVRELVLYQRAARKRYCFGRTSVWMNAALKLCAHATWISRNSRSRADAGFALLCCRMRLAP